MSDIYNRVTELAGLTKTLSHDVDLLSPNLGDRTPVTARSEVENANRRSYVRAVFALVEALVEQHKLLLLDLSRSHAVALLPGVGEALAEQTYEVKRDGRVAPRPQYLTLGRKIRAVYLAASDAFGEPIADAFGDHGWESLQEGLRVRDRITHPKSRLECIIQDADLRTVDEGRTWFQGLSNAFARIAQQHHDEHGW